jgi:hypothetical protein
VHDAAAPQFYMLDEWEFSGRRRLLLRPNPDGSQHADAAVALKLAPAVAVSAKHSNDCKHHNSSCNGTVCADNSDSMLEGSSTAGAVQAHAKAANNSSPPRRQHSANNSDDSLCNGDVTAEPSAGTSADCTTCCRHQLLHERSESAVRSLDFTAAAGAQFDTMSSSEAHTMSVLDTESSSGHSRNSSSSSFISSSSNASSSTGSETTAAVARDSGGSSIPHTSTHDNSSSSGTQHRSSVRSSCNSGGDSVDSTAATGGSGARSSGSASSSSERTKHTGYVSMESAQKLWAGLRLHSAVAAAEDAAEAQVNTA